MHKYDLNVRMVNHSSKKLKDIFKMNNSDPSKHEKCDSCNILLTRYNCNIKITV